MEKLKAHTIVGVVTQPAKPVGRDKIITPTPVEIWAKKHTVPVLTFENDPEKSWLYTNEQQVIDTLQPLKPDLLISASYGQKIPTKTITHAPYGGLNVHPSILPRWRGGDPVPWAIMEGDHQIGVTIVTLAEKFDEGLIIEQKKIPIRPDDTAPSLRTKLFELGAQLLVDVLPGYIAGKHKGKSQHGSTEPYAKRLTREIGFEEWNTLKKAMEGDREQSARIEKKYRALHPWPGIWTTLSNEKRLKILKLHLEQEKLIIDDVQLEGKKPVPWSQFVSAYDPLDNE